MKTDFFWKGFVFYFTILTAIVMIASTCLLIPDLRSGNQGAYWLLGFNLLALVAVAFIHYVEFVDYNKRFKQFTYDIRSVKQITGYHRVSQLLRHIPYFRNKRIRYYHNMRFIISALQKAPSEDVLLQSVLKEIDG